MKFIDSVLMNTGGKTITVPAGSYENLNFRFSGAQSGAVAPTQVELGAIDIYYRNTPRSHILFSELGVYNDKKGGAREVTQPAGDTQPLAWNFILTNAHPDDKNNVLYVADDKELKIVWTPSTNLAARVSAASLLRVTGSEKLGTMNYFYGWKRTTVNMVVGDTTPLDVLPYNISSIFVEYDGTNIDNLDLMIDGRPEEQSSEIVELINQDLHRNRIETYAASGFAEIDLLKSKNPDESLNNSVKLTLRGSGATAIEVFWQYFDYTPTAKQISESEYNRRLNQIVTNKTVTGGSPAVAVVKSLSTRMF